MTPMGCPTSATKFKARETQIAQTKNSLYTRLDELMGRALSAITCDDTGENTIDLEKEINAKKVIIFELSGRLGPRQGPALGRLVLAMLRAAALRRDELLRRNIEPVPVHVFVDECHNYVSSSIKKIREFRKYRVLLTLIQTELGAEMPPETKDAVLGATTLKIAGRAGEPQAVARVLRVDESDIAGLDKAEFILRSAELPYPIRFKAHGHLADRGHSMSEEEWQPGVEAEDRYVLSAGRCAGPAPAVSPTRSATPEVARASSPDGAAIGHPVQDRPRSPKNPKTSSRCGPPLHMDIPHSIMSTILKTHDSLNRRFRKGGARPRGDRVTRQRNDLAILEAHHRFGPRTPRPSIRSSIRSTGTGTHSNTGSNCSGTKKTQRIRRSPHLLPLAAARGAHLPDNNPRVYDVLPRGEKLLKTPDCGARITRQRAAISGGMTSCATPSSRLSTVAAKANGVKFFYPDKSSRRSPTPLCRPNLHLPPRERRKARYQERRQIAAGSILRASVRGRHQANFPCRSRLPHRAPANRRAAQKPQTQHSPIPRAPQGP